MLARVCFIVALMGLLAGCDRRSENSERAPSAPRIAVLSPALSATLVEMGLGDSIVARHAYDAVLGSSVPSVGDESALDVEALLRTRPTHVLIDSASRESLAYVRVQAERHAWSVHAFDLRTLDAIAQSARDLRRLFAPKSEDALEAVASFEEAIKPRRLAFDGWVLLLAQTDPPGAIGPASFHGEILERLGAHNVLPQGVRWHELDAEDVLRLDPDAIVVIRWHTPGLAPIADPEEALGGLRGLELSAIDEGRVAIIDDPLALLPSIALAGFADRLREILESFES